MRDLIFISAFIALLGFFAVVRGEDEKPLPQGQLRLLISPGEIRQTITRPRDDHEAQKGELIVSCESLSFDQGTYVFKNGTLETASGYISFTEVAVTYSGNSISIASPTANKPLKDIQFRLKAGDASKILAAPSPK